MTVGRLFAIALIFGCISIAWIALGGSVAMRTNTGYDALGNEVSELWGGPHVQQAPSVTAQLSSSRQRQRLEPTSSDINVALRLDQRRKGLLWYSTYEVDFDGRYTAQNTLDEPVTATIEFTFPTSGAIYDNFEFRVGEVSVRPGGGTGERLRTTTTLDPGESVDIHLAYRSRGLDRWVYRFANSMTTVQNFHLAVETDFDDYDFPARTISASNKTRTPDGWRLEWEFANLVSDADIGVACGAVALFDEGLREPGVRRGGDHGDLP